MKHMDTVPQCMNFTTTKTWNFEVLTSEMSLYGLFTLRYTENLRRNGQELRNIAEMLTCLGVTATSTRSLPFHHLWTTSTHFLSVRSILLQLWHWHNGKEDARQSLCPQKRQRKTPCPVPLRVGPVGPLLWSHIPGRNHSTPNRHSGTTLILSWSSKMLPKPWFLSRGPLPRSAMPSSNMSGMMASHDGRKLMWLVSTILQVRMRKAIQVLRTMKSSTHAARWAMKVWNFLILHPIWGLPWSKRPWNTFRVSATEGAWQ